MPADDLDVKAITRAMLIAALAVAFVLGVGVIAPADSEPAEVTASAESSAGPQLSWFDSLVGAAAPVATAAEPARDPWLRPFTSTSIWNMPIGSDARYVDAELPWTRRQLIESSYLLQTTEEDPARELMLTGGWKRRCLGTVSSGKHLHLPDGWMPRTVTDRSTPNNPGVFLQPDGRTLWNIGGMARCSGSGPLYGIWPGPNYHVTDLYGDGRFGAHGGSNLSQLGGAIRPGELTGDEPINHALDLLIWSEHLYWGGSKANSFRWPASRSDSYSSAQRYRGDVPELQMGSLLALPPSATPDSLGVTTEVGEKLFDALQDYGAYITDDSAWDAAYIGVDSQAVGTFAWGDAEKQDMARMMSELHVVANNGPNSIGGGGTPRQPLLPELVPPDENDVRPPPVSTDTTTAQRPTATTTPTVTPNTTTSTTPPATSTVPPPSGGPSTTTPTITPNTTTADTVASDTATSTTSPATSTVPPPSGGPSTTTPTTAATTTAVPQPSTPEPSTSTSERPPDVAVVPGAGGAAVVEGVIVQAIDRFDRAWGSTLAERRGLDWVEHEGQFRVEQGEALAEGSGRALATIDVGVPDVAMTSSIRMSDTQSSIGLATRADDADNLIGLTLTRRGGDDASDALALAEVDNGEFQWIAGAPSAGLELGGVHNVELVAEGQRIIVKVDGEPMIDHVLDDAVYARRDGTGHGLWSLEWNDTGDRGSAWQHFELSVR